MTPFPPFSFPSHPNKMKTLPALPHMIGSRFLATLADADEQFAICIEVMSAPYGLGPLTIPGATQHTYQYVLSRGQSTHRLIIPLSVWRASKRKLARDIFEMPDPSVILIPDLALWEDVYSEAAGGQKFRKVVPVSPEPVQPPSADTGSVDELTTNAPDVSIDSEQTKEKLIESAGFIGLKIDKRWGPARIKKEIANAITPPES